MRDHDRAFPSKTALVLALTVALVGSAFAGCVSSDRKGASLKQTGSSTVLPLAERWAATFGQAQIEVSGGGSSHGLNSLLTGKAQLGDASRKIGTGDYAKVGCEVSADELESARAGEHPWQYPACQGVTPTEWVVAYDVLTVVVNPENDWVTGGLNYTQLRSIFTSEGTATYWDEVPGLEGAPHERIEIFAPDEASGTYEFFFEEVAGSTQTSLLASGSDRYSGSANDNEILRAIKSQTYAVGFFGFAYYLESEDQVTAIPIAEDDGEPAAPSFETVADYPLTRPLHVYTDGIPGENGTKAAAVNAYLSFALGEQGQSVVPDVGYIPVADVSSGKAQAQVAALG